MKKPIDKITNEFIKSWGQEMYNKIIEIAESHGNGINNNNIGHKLKWALLICIGYQCMEKPEYRKYHQFPKFDWSKMKKWIKENAELKTYKGDTDYLSLFAGVYNEYMKNK